MTTIKFRRDTSANWTSVNPIPAQGEPCYETDTGKLKIGNGSDNYVTLPYVSDGGAANLPIASTTILGAIKVGDNLTIAPDGTLSATGGSVDSYTKSETDALLSEKNDNIFDIGKFTVVGNPTITDDGVASGFSSNTLSKCFRPANRLCSICSHHIGWSTTTSSIRYIR